MLPRSWKLYQTSNIQGEFVPDLFSKDNKAQKAQDAGAAAQVGDAVPCLDHPGDGGLEWFQSDAVGDVAEVFFGHEIPILMSGRRPGKGRRAARAGLHHDR